MVTMLVQALPLRTGRDCEGQIGRQTGLSKEKGLEGREEKSYSAGNINNIKNIKISSAFH